MKFLAGLFKDTGDISMMRVLSFICVCTASGVALYAVATGGDLSATAVLCGVFLGAGITGKVAQRAIEAKDVSGE